jgi:hypothetical protein
VRLCFISPKIRTRAFPKRSLSTGLAQKVSCSSERREIVTRRNSLDEIRELLTQGLIGKSTGQGVERPKFQPARALCGGDFDGTAQRSPGGRGFSVAMSQLTINSPELGLEIPLVVAV